MPESTDDFDALTELASIMRMITTVKDTFGEPTAQPPHDMLETCWQILRCELQAVHQEQQKRRPPPSE